jgi:hypothetical protein
MPRPRKSKTYAILDQGTWAKITWWLEMISANPSVPEPDAHRYTHMYIHLFIFSRGREHDMIWRSQLELLTSTFRSLPTRWWLTISTTMLRPMTAYSSWHVSNSQWACGSFTRLVYKMLDPSPGSFSKRTSLMGSGWGDRRCPSKCCYLLARPSRRSNLNFTVLQEFVTGKA